MQCVTLLAALAAALVGASDGLSPHPPCACDGSVLDCSKRNLTSLPPSASCSEALTAKMEGNIFQVFPDGLTAFETIKMSRNRLTHLPTASQLNPEVKDLELNDNLISESSDEFRTLSRLRRLRLENNNVTSLEFLPTDCNLYNLDVSANAISSIAGPLQNCTQLAFLGLADNQITILPTGFFTKMKKLKYLYLYNNKISSIPDGTFVGLSVLKDISLQMNKNLLLSSGSFQGLSQLQTLDLSFNNIASLPAGIFASTPKLEKLNIVVNKLPDLPQNIFSGLDFLRELLLWDNELTQIPVLENCCSSLENFNLLGNNITAPTEAALSSVLRGKIYTKIGAVPVRPEAVLWAIGEAEAYVGTRCSCGGLRRGTAKVDFCVDVVCGPGSPYADWRAAVAGAPAA